MIKSTIKNLKSNLLTIYTLIRRKLYKENCIYLVYTMGKVGSQTIYYSLKKKLPYSNILHVHFLSNNYLKNRIPKLPEHFHNRIDHGNKILNELNKHRNKRLKIITLTREPIARSISTLFQDNSTILGNTENIDINTLRQHVEKEDFRYDLEWFDEEFYNYLNFDIYSKKFDKDKGYEIYNLDKMDVLCIKLERLNDVYQVAIKEFIGKHIKLEIYNSSLNKLGKDKYLFLKNNVKISPEKLDKIYYSKYIKHFYTKEEIQSFIDKWS